jgi:hypothetical protein
MSTARRTEPQDRPTHPMRASLVLVIAVSLLIVLLAAASTW